MTAKSGKVNAVLSHFGNAVEKSSVAGMNTGLYLSSIAKTKIVSDTQINSMIARKTKSPGYNKTSSPSSPNSFYLSQSTLTTVGMPSGEESFAVGHDDEELFDMSNIADPSDRRSRSDKDQKRNQGSDSFNTKESHGPDRPKEGSKTRQSSIGNRRASVEGSMTSRGSNESDQLCTTIHSNASEKSAVGIDKHRRSRRSSEHGAISLKVNESRRSLVGSRRSSVGNNPESPMNKGSIHSHESNNSNTTETTTGSKVRDKSDRRKTRNGTRVDNCSDSRDEKPGTQESYHSRHSKISIDCSAHSKESLQSHESFNLKSSLERKNDRSPRTNHSEHRHDIEKHVIDGGSKRNPKEAETHIRYNKRGSQNGGVQRSKSNDLPVISTINRGLTRSKLLSDEHEQVNLRRGRRTSTEVGNSLGRKENMKSKASVKEDNFLNSCDSDEDESSDDDVFKIKFKSTKGVNAKTNGKNTGKLDAMINSDPNSSGLIHYDYSDDESFVQSPSKPRQVPENGCLGIREDDENSDDDRRGEEVVHDSFLRNTNGCGPRKEIQKSRRSSLDLTSSNQMRPSYRKAKMDQVHRRRSQTGC